MSDFTPEQVERAAEELWQNALRRGASHWKSWGAVDGYAKEEYLEFASAVLSAAGAPEKVAPVVDEAEKALQRARELHAETPYDDGIEPICSECTRVSRYGVVYFPCPTAEALWGESK